MTVEINTTQDIAERIKELMRKKKKLNATIKRGRKIQVKARIEKKKVVTELTKLKKDGSLFRGMTVDEARKAVKDAIEATDPKDVYPADLERTFDRLEKPSVGEHKVVDLGKIPERPISKNGDDDDDAEVVGVADVATEDDDVDDGVVDLSDQ